MKTYTVIQNGVRVPWVVNAACACDAMVRVLEQLELLHGSGYCPGKLTAKHMGGSA